MSQTQTLPTADQWFGTDEWRDHLLNHFGSRQQDCAGCQVQPLLRDIHDAVFNDNKRIPKAAIIAWQHQDGYGEVGFTPDQGWDWSGIRDSSPAAVHNMAAALGLL